RVPRDRVRLAQLDFWETTDESQSFRLGTAGVPPIRLHPGNLLSLAGSTQRPSKARVLDVSTGGVALWLNRWYDSGTFLAVDLPGEKGDPDVHPSVVKIQYAVPQGGNWWMVGAAFARNRRQEEIKALL